MQQHGHDHDHAGHAHGPPAPAKQGTPVQGPGPEAKARIEAMKKQFAQKKLISGRLAKIKNKIAVYSGKGGVGKSTVAVNLAVQLAIRGKSVGIMDADIDCPNVVKLMKGESLPDLVDNQIIPAVMHGVKVISMASFQQKEDEAIIFRGPMIHNALTQFIEVTEWGELDYLIIDMPPGTSDAALTVMQTLQLDGFVIVTTPQELAILDAKRSINMIKKLNVPILGIVENMSGDIFGKGGGEKLANDLNVPFLGAIELRSGFREPPKPASMVDRHIQKEFDAIIEKLKVPQPA